jgi:hypothetical protein
LQEKELRQKLLGGRKTERVIFAVTPETKAALETISKDQCVSVSALLTSLIIDEAIKQKDLFEEE